MQPGMCAMRKPWTLDFAAEPDEVSALRRVVRSHLGLWGVREVADLAELCVTEMVTNVIKHVGYGTPSTLAVSMRGTYVRVEVQDPDTRALPTLIAATSGAEAGRGIALVDAVADRWGVQLREDRKVIWCELATGLKTPGAHTGGARVTRAEALLHLYGQGQFGRVDAAACEANVAVAEEAAIALIADLLHWLQHHGCDADESLDRAQNRYEKEAEGTLT